MAKESFFDKFKGLFIEVPSKNESNNYDFQQDTKEDSKLVEMKKLIDDVIVGNKNSKEEIIEALKNCEDVFFDEEKELEIMSAIGALQNEPEVLKTFIDVTMKYGRFDYNKHHKIIDARSVAQNKYNTILFEDIINSNENEYTDKDNIGKVLTLIKNERIKFASKEDEQNSIIRIFNNINEDLYNDIKVVELLHLVFDNKMKNNDLVKKTTASLKKKINVYYNTEGTIEDKNMAMNRITLNKISDKDLEDTSDEYDDALEVQEKRIMSSDLPLEEKESLVRQLHNEFNEYTAEMNNVKTL